MDVGKRISYLREQKGITVNKLANLAGISQSFLRDIELGNKQPTIEYLSYICDALGIALELFFHDTANDDEITIALLKLSEQQRKELVRFLKSL